jgi:UDP-2,4-diacetamido-2,4,6-trideoxy-beta-L-altropyranose hydrolase
VNQTLVIRADANTNIGAGHVLRCLALAQAWQNEGRQVFYVSVEPPPWLEKRLRQEKIEIIPLDVPAGSQEDALQTAQLSKNQNASWVVIDGYHFDSLYHKTVKDSGSKLLALDDNGSPFHHYADFILNQNLHAQEILYPDREPYSRLLLGNRYVLLRKDFFPWRNWKRPCNPKPNKILVTLGGGDHNNVTSKVITALQAISSPKTESIIVAGGSNPHFEVLQAQVRKAGARFQIKRDAINLPELMAWADIAISAAGSTAWELAFMMLPSLLLVLSKNQEPVAQQLDLKGIAINLNSPDDISIDGIVAAASRLLASVELRTTMSERGRRLIDGEGSQRVLMHLDGRQIRLKMVSQEECRLIWELANEPKTREASFFPDPIPWEDHLQWFQSKLSDPNCSFYVVINTNEEPIGQVRFALHADEAIISFSVSRKHQGKGYGTQLIRIASDEIFKNRRATKISAYVKKSNEISIQAFLKSGYINSGSTHIHGQEAINLIQLINNL